LIPLLKMRSRGSVRIIPKGGIRGASSTNERRKVAEETRWPLTG